jgi:hypothetical protein
MISILLFISVFIAVLLVSFSAEQVNIDDSDYSFVKSLNLTGANTYAAAVNYGKTHPNRDGGSWNGWCVLLYL